MTHCDDVVIIICQRQVNFVPGTILVLENFLPSPYQGKFPNCPFCLTIAGWLPATGYAYIIAGWISGLVLSGTIVIL